MLQPSVEKEGKSLNQSADGGINLGLVRETSLIRKCSAVESPELGKTFKQAVKEPVSGWCGRLGVMGEHRVSLLWKKRQMM